MLPFLVEYDGGGDWYANKTALPNLIAFCNENLGTYIAAEEDVVEVGSPELFLYPYVYMTGHGNMIFSDNQAENLRRYLLAGGFLHVDDNYGLDPFFRVGAQEGFPDNRREHDHLPRGRRVFSVPPASPAT